MPTKLCVAKWGLFPNREVGESQHSQRTCFHCQGFVRGRGNLGRGPLAESKSPGLLTVAGLPSPHSLFQERNQPDLHGKQVCSRSLTRILCSLARNPQALGSCDLRKSGAAFKDRKPPTAPTMLGTTGTSCYRDSKAVLADGQRAPSPFTRGLSLLKSSSLEIWGVRTKHVPARRKPVVLDVQQHVRASW